MEVAPRSRWHDVFVAVATVLPVFVIVAYVSTLEKALLAGTVVGAMWVAASERWQSRDKAGFWPLIVVFGIINVIGIWAIPITGEFRAGLVVSYPLAMAEGVLLYWLLGRLD
jgi:hypothetical protein